MRRSIAWSLALAVAVIPFQARAEDGSSKRAIEELRKEVEELRQTVRELQKALKQQAAHATPAAAGQTEQEKELEAEIRAAMPAATPAATPAAGEAVPASIAAVQPAAGPGVGKSSSLLNPNISFIGDFVFLGTDNRQLSKANQFSFREAEVGFQAPIDPFARADAFLTVDEGGNLDVEEAYATFLDLPGNLQARAGKFRLMFGKNNVLHRHALPQTDRPFAEVDNFGDEGFAGTGGELSWLVPNPWDQYLLLSGEVVNDLGEPTAVSQGVPLQQPPAGRVFRDFVYLGHAQSFFDLNADNNIELGASALFNLPKSSTQTRIYGVDLTYRWRPLQQAGYHQFLWRSEGYFTDKQLRGTDAAALPVTESSTFNTAGFYTYGEYRLAQRWWLGTRVDWTEIPAERHRTEWDTYPYCTFAPTEFGYFRLGYQYAMSDKLQKRESNRVWLQYDFSIGPHAAHAF
ncbi:MAG TPA: hypothetical protein VN812_17175 [Candidatus Acidoferrales bacterium]|nr:hypothetical protein [Candidatus Acidoferrales bacterium]